VLSFLLVKIQNNEPPDKIMMNVHPQRWNDHGFQWYKELVGQNVKNVVKRILVRFRDWGIELATPEKNILLSVCIRG